MPDEPRPRALPARAHQRVVVAFGDAPGLVRLAQVGQRVEGSDPNARGGTALGETGEQIRVDRAGDRARDPAQQDHPIVVDPSTEATRPVRRSK